MTRLRTVLLLIMGMLIFQSCLKDKTPQNSHLIQLKWNKIHTEDSFDQALVGLSWAFSHVGASHTRNLYQMPTTTTTVTVNMRELGFTTQAEELLEELNRLLMKSEEYTVHSAIDMGRYVALLIGASEHYYALTDMPEQYSELLAEYELKTIQGYVDSSAISLKHRIIHFSDQNGLHQLFVSEETDPISGEILEFETVDLMPNGQPRFGIFDADGHRENVANPSNSEAGKPAKCMWCHESDIQPLFFEQSDFEGYLTFLELRDTLLHFRNALQAKQSTLADGVDYSALTEHIQMELLYIGFMEPSAERLSLEWDLSVDNVKEKLADLPTHENEEFPFLGELYDREDVNSFSPYTTVQVSTNIREESEIEVNYLEL